MVSGNGPTKGLGHPMSAPNPLLRMKRERRVALAIMLIAFAVFWGMGRSCPPLVQAPPAVEQEAPAP